MEGGFALDFVAEGEVLGCHFGVAVEVTVLEEEGAGEVGGLVVGEPDEQRVETPQGGHRRDTGQPDTMNTRTPYKHTEAILGRLRAW